MAFKSPLTRQQYDAMKKEERSLQDTLEMCDRAERCNIDVGQYRGVIDELRGRISAYEREFFSPVPK